MGTETNSITKAAVALGRFFIRLLSIPALFFYRLLWIAFVDPLRPIFQGLSPAQLKEGRRILRDSFGHIGRSGTSGHADNLRWGARAWATFVLGLVVSPTLILVALAYKLGEMCVVG